MMDATRSAVRKRAVESCEYCRLPQAWDMVKRLQIEHIIAKQHRGRSTLENLALACTNCNGHKRPNLSGIDPESGETVKLFHPRRDDWDEHFLQDDDGKIHGLTATGRATVIVLAMNDEDRVTVRAAYLASINASFEK